MTQSILLQIYEGLISTWDSYVDNILETSRTATRKYVHKFDIMKKIIIAVIKHSKYPIPKYHRYETSSTASIKLVVK